MALKPSPDELQILANHVAPLDPSDPTAFISTFNAALREARTVAGRDVETGRSTGERPLALWAGTLVYLVLLEQIGHLFRPAHARDLTIKESNVERALRQFTHGTTAMQREAVYALRNAFAHEFGLFNPGWADSRYRFAFILDDEPAQPLIKRPARTWSGRPEDVSRRTRTTLNLVTLGDRCEEVVVSVRACAAVGSLRCSSDVAHLPRRFGFRILDDPAELP